MLILVTGEAGYICSHTIVGLINAGHDVISKQTICAISQKRLSDV